MQESQQQNGFRKNSLRLRDFDYAARHTSFVTIVTHERREFFKDNRVADSTTKCLLDLREKQNFRLFSFCLMPDHLHALIGIGESGLTLGRICGDFKSLSTKAFWQFYTGKMWQRQFFDHVIRNEQDFAETLKYIRLNPVRKGLVGDWKEWKYQGEPDL